MAESVTPAAPSADAAPSTDTVPFDGAIQKRSDLLGIWNERTAAVHLPAGGVGAGTLVWQGGTELTIEPASVLLDEECTVRLEGHELLIRHGWRELRWRKSPSGPALEVWLAAIAAVRAACSSRSESSGDAVQRRLPSSPAAGSRDFWEAPEATARHRSKSFLTNCSPSKMPPNIAFTKRCVTRPLKVGSVCVRS